MRARIIKMDGSGGQVVLPEDGELQLDTLRFALAATTVSEIPLIENAPGRPGLSMWIDTDGMFDKTENFPAMALAKAVAIDPITELIAGDVMVTGALDSAGDILGLTEMQDEVLAEYIPDLASMAMAGV